MPEFTVNFDDVNAQDVIAIHDTDTRKKPIALGDNVKTKDKNGNVCYGFVERLDKRCGLLWVAIDRSTFVSRSYA